ncbi:MAG: hypothetical protein LBU97_06065 [Alistipes sp.]|jgi:LytS/YehU family sensor histidine kinase|nr:hypothetical protein [Alistipes sp.]
MIARLIKTNALYLVGALVGGVGGYLYYYFVGCTAGGCPITSSPVASVVWGGVLGALLLSLFKKDKK